MGKFALTNEKGGFHMPHFSEGDLVGIHCAVQPGPFEEEKLVSVETDSGFISGFVKTENLKIEREGDGYVKGIVVSSSADHLMVRLFGSFFTTALGMASVDHSKARRLAA